MLNSFKIKFRILGVLFLALLMFSCTTSNISKSKGTKNKDPFNITSTLKKENKKGKKHHTSKNKRTYEQQEVLWAKKQVFSDSEKKHASISDYNFFKKNSIVELNIDDIYRYGTFPFNGIFTSDFGIRNGRQHDGLDISARNGETEIHALLGGIVKVSSYINGYGNTVIIRHMNGLETLYAHNKNNKVKHGDIVKAGQIIAIVGSTGKVSGPHLHFEVRVNGKVIDPKYIVNPKTKTIKQGTIYLQQISNGSIVVSKDNSHSSVASNRIHIVKKGDTLYSLARKYGVTVKELRKINNISENNELLIGQRLRIM